MNKKASRRFRRFGIFLLIVPIGLWSFVKDDNYFEISKNLEIFTSIYKELNIFDVVTIPIHQSRDEDAQTSNPFG